MEMTRKPRVVISSVFLSLILSSFTVLQYRGTGAGSRRYSGETNKTLVGRPPWLRELPHNTSHSTERQAVTIESCLGVSEPAWHNVRSVHLHSQYVSCIGNYQNRSLKLCYDLFNFQLNFISSDLHFIYISLQPCQPGNVQ